MAKSYPAGYATSVDEREWLSQPEAASLLGTSLTTVGLLIANRHLTPAETPSRTWGTPRVLKPGVTWSSVSAELEWRRSSSRTRRARRFARDLANWL